MNAAACELFGLTRDELLAQAVDDGSPDANVERRRRGDLLADGTIAGATPIERPRRHDTRGRVHRHGQRAARQASLGAPRRHRAQAAPAGALAGAEARERRHARRRDRTRLQQHAHGDQRLFEPAAGASCPGSVERHHVEEIEQAAARAAKLTAQLLAFGRRQVLQPRSVDLCGLVGELLPMLEHVVGSEVRSPSSPASTSARSIADPAQMEQVILNVVVNAAEAMPIGGHVAIRTRDVDVEHDVAAANGVTARELAAGRYVELSISDSGSGMDGETLEHVFEPFFTTKPVGVGDGLGLSTAYGIVKQSGGTIVAESAGGSGTTFPDLSPRGPGSREPERGTRNAVGAAILPLVSDDNTPSRRDADRVSSSIRIPALGDLVSAGLDRGGLRLSWPAC